MSRRWALTGAGAVVALAALVPYLVMLLTSLKPSEELANIPPTVLPTRWEWSNYVAVWSSAPVADYLRSSAVVALGSTVLVMVVGVPAAYYSARVAFLGRRPFLLLVLGAQIFAPVSLIVGLYREAQTLHLLDSWLGLILMNAAFNAAFTIWLLRGFVAALPTALEEAAWLDGCSRLSALLHVVLPTIRPGLVTAAIYAFIAAWNEFVLALTLITTPSRKTLQVGLTEFIGRDHVDWQYLFAASLVAIVPVVALFLLIEKNLVSGLSTGAVK